MSVQGVTSVARNALKDVISSTKIKCRSFDTWDGRQQVLATLGVARYVTAEEIDQSYGFQQVIIPVRLYYKVTHNLDKSLEACEKSIEVIIDALGDDRRLGGRVVTSAISEQVNQTVWEAGDMRFIMTEFSVIILPFPNTSAG